MTFVEYPDRDMMMLALADKIAGQLGDFIRREGRASLSVPGGTTPGPVFDVLSQVDLDWSKVAIFLNDERWVPESAPRSNTRLLRDRLLVNRAAAATLVPLYGGAETPEEQMETLGQGIAPHLPISVLLLGMGTDGHTASIFPGADRLDEALSPKAPILLPMRAPGAPEPRITLSMPVLTAAMNTHILITGAEKRDALERAQKSDVTEAPVRGVLGNATVHWAE